MLRSACVRASRLAHRRTAAAAPCCAAPREVDNTATPAQQCCRAASSRTGDASARAAGEAVERALSSRELPEAPLAAVRSFDNTRNGISRISC